MIIDEPTDRQLEILRFIGAGIDAGRVPTIREIGEKFEISSTNGVRDHLMLLEKKGLLIRGERSARSLTLTAAGQRWVYGTEPRCSKCGQRIRRAA
jgi:repressor LexA